MVQEPRIVYLVDGSSYVHRAYHAIRHLSNSKGFPTNAAFGFAKMVLKLFQDRRPEYLAIAFDMKGPTFRHTIYKEYKANRPPMPEDLSLQLPHIRTIVKGLNVVMMEREGYEADDVIGTLARGMEEKGFRVVIVTGDKDFRQLITPLTSLWDTMKDSYMDLDAFRKEYGLEPSQVIDMMGLAGDTSDNVPGVPGVGEKTAMALIREYGSMEEVFQRVDEIKQKKLQEKLRNSFSQAVLSKKLVTIDRYVPLEWEPEALKVREPDGRVLTEVFRELEFKGLWEQFAVREEPDSKDYRLCLSQEELVSIMERIKREGTVSIDTETTGIDPLKAGLVGISFSLEEGKGYYLPLAHDYLGAPKQLDLSAAIPALREVLEDEKIAKVGQNVKYDALVLRRHGIELRGIHFDTMVASYVINPGLRQHSLDNLSQHFLNHKMITYEEVVGRGKSQISFSEVAVSDAMEYSCEDADISLRLMHVLQKKLHSDMNEELFYDVEMALIPVLVDMEWRGIKTDTRFFREMSRHLSGELAKIEMEIYAEAGMEFNINSPQQLSSVLFEKLQLPVQKKTLKTRVHSTDVKVLKTLSSLPFKMPKLLLRYRTMTKLKSTYLDALVKLVNPETGRIHTSFNQTVTATGRLSSSNPNLQNIPVRGEEGREIRKGFVAEEGHYLLSADYSQVELRIFAHYSGDPAFLEAFQREEDIHSRTAGEILGVEPGAVTPEMRRIAKAINFGIIYGMGPQKLAEELGIDHKTARDYISAYYARYRGVAKYREETVAAAREKGYVTTLFHRRRYLPDINHDNRVMRGEAERMAVNTPIQGTAADLIKKAMIAIHRRVKSEKRRSHMLLQVHDELLFEVPEDEIHAISRLVKEEMEGVHPLRVPLKVDVRWGRNWDEAH